MKLPELPLEANVMVGAVRWPSMGKDFERPDASVLVQGDLSAHYYIDTPAGRAALAAYVCAVLDQLINEHDDLLNIHDGLWEAQHDFLYGWRDEWAKYGGLPIRPDFLE